ncbi:MAG: tetratricopeptide repeat protein [Verrucomicrobiota bacterium]
MTKSSPDQPIPSPTVGKSFKVAAGLLIAFLAIQALLVAWHFLPVLQQAIVRQAVAEKPDAPPTATAPEIPTEATPQATPASTPTGPDEATYEKITSLVADSDKAFRIGEYDQGLAKIQEANALLPNDPGILLRIARLHEKRGEPGEAASVYNAVLALPNLGEELRKQTRRRLGMLTLPETETPPTMVAATEGADMRDEFGLQPGAILGIVDTKLNDGPDGTKTLLISIKARPGEAIATSDMRVHVFFYDRDADGEMRPTDSKILTEWMSPPVDWGENEPELLNATYTPPDPSDSANQGITFGGYVVGIYYKGELQDTRANPGPLADEHPLPLSLPAQTP